MGASQPPQQKNPDIPPVDSSLQLRFQCMHCRKRQFRPLVSCWPGVVRCCLCTQPVINFGQTAAKPPRNEESIAGIDGTVVGEIYQFTGKDGPRSSRKMLIPCVNCAGTMALDGRQWGQHLHCSHCGHRFFFPVTRLIAKPPRAISAVNRSGRQDSWMMRWNRFGSYVCWPLRQYERASLSAMIAGAALVALAVCGSFIWMLLSTIR